MITQRLTTIKAKAFIVSLGLITIVAGSIIAKPAYAEGISLRIIPSTIKIKTQTPSDIKAPFVIENQSNQSIKLKIAYKLFDPSQSQEGKVVFLDNLGSSADIFSNVYVVDNTNARIVSLELGPKQQKQLQLRVLLPQNQPEKDYYFSLIFFNDITQQADQSLTINNKGDQKTLATIQGGLGANVLLAVGNPETPQGYIEDFSTSWYRQSGPVPFTVKVKNTGVHYISPKGNILVRNVFGHDIARIDIPETAILAGTTRSLFDQKQLENVVSELDEPQVVWQDTFLFGIYSAQINLAMSDNGPINTQTIRFMVFPTHVLLGLIFLICFGIILFNRVKKKIS